MDYFKDLYSFSGTMTEPILRTIRRRLLDDEHNNSLIQRSEAHEVKEALLSMHLDKSLDPDDMNLGFYQAYWDIMGD